VEQTQGVIDRIKQLSCGVRSKDSASSQEAGPETDSGLSCERHNPNQEIHLVSPLATPQGVIKAFKADRRLFRLMGTSRRVSRTMFRHFNKVVIYYQKGIVTL